MRLNSLYWAGALTLGCVLGACGSPELSYEDREDIPLPSRDVTADGSDTSVEDANADEDVNGTEPVESTDEVETDTTESNPGADDAAEDATEESGSDDEVAEETVANEPVDYFMDDADSLLYAQVWKDEGTLASGLAHDHVIRATQWGGQVTYDPRDLSTCYIAFEMPVAEMRADEPAMRSLVGFDSELSESDRAEVEGNMKGEDILHAGSHPTIRFDSSFCEGEGGSSGELMVTGDVTMRGRTKTVTIPVTFQLVDDQLYAQGKIDAVHGDFGMEPYSAFLGAIRVADPIVMTFDIVGKR